MAFDPFTQNITLLTANNDSFNISFTDLGTYVSYKVQVCTNFGAQLGASLTALVMLVLLTKPDKRGSAIIIINAFSLVFSIIRNVFQIIVFTGPFSDQYAYFAEDFSRVPANSYRCSVVGTIFQLLLQISVESSLCLQTWVVCVTLRPLYRRTVGLISLLVAFMSVGFRFAYMVKNDIAIVTLNSEEDLYWIAHANNVVTAISILWFCVVFCSKLGYAIWQRRKLGIAQFGPMQILFIMGCQTLIVPAILAILQDTLETPALSSNVLTAVAIFLPLSSLWASAKISQTQSDRSTDRRNFVATYPSGYSWQPVHSTTSKSQGRKESAQTIDSSRQFGSDCQSSPEQQKFYQDLEKSGLTVNGEFARGLP